MIRTNLRGPSRRVSAILVFVALLCLTATVTIAQTCEFYDHYLKWVGNCDLPGTGSSWNGLCVAVQGDFAYVGENGSMCIVDIRNPTDPVRRGTLPLPGRVLDIEVQGDYAYLDVDDIAMQIVNITAPDAPTLAGSIGTTVTGLLAVDGNLVYMVRYLPARGRNGIVVIDVTNKMAPVWLHSQYIDGFTVNSLTKKDNYLYFGAKGEFIVLNVTTPTAPSTVLRQTVNNPNSF